LVWESGNPLLLFFSIPGIVFAPIELFAFCGPTGAGAFHQSVD
jgi:hypothetical protein